MSSRNAADTRIAILDAARHLFEIEAYDRVGLEAVAKQAGVSRQAIYLHFDSRAALLDALHRRINEQDVEPAMARVWRSADAGSALDAFVGATATVAPRILGIFNALEAASRVEPVAETTWEPPRASREADCLRMAEWLAGESQLAPRVTARHAADVLFTMASIRAYESLVVGRGWSGRRWTAWTRESLRTLLLAPA